MVVTTNYLNPTRVVSVGARTPPWTNPDHVQNNPAGSAAEGDPYTTLPDCWASLAAGAQSDTLNAGNFNFNIPLNAKVNGITVEVIRSGDYVTDTWLALRLAGNYLANKAKQRSRTDDNLLVDWYGNYNNDLWGASKILPADINENNGYNGFGVSEVVKNTRTISNTVRIHSIGIKVGYTNPTYSLISNLPAIALLGTQINYQIILTNTNGIDNQEAIPVNVPIPAGFTLVSATSSEGIYNESVGVWSPVLNKSTSKATLNLILEASTIGTQTQTVTETEFNTTLSKSCNIVGSDSGPINYTDVVISDAKTLANMNDGEIYTIGAYNKVVDNGISGIFAGVKNNHISVINSGLSTFAEALNNIEADEDELIHINLIGDSITEGFWAATSEPNLTLLSYVGLLRSYYQELYGDCGKGYVNSTFHRVQNPAWTFDTNWSLYTAGWSGLGGNSYYTKIAGATASHTFVGTGFKLFYFAYNTNGKFTYSIDGGSPVTVDSSTSDNFGAYVSITDLPMGEHTITITKIDNDNKTVYIHGGYALQTVNNKVPANVEKGTDVTEDTTGYQASAGISYASSTEWHKRGSRSCRVTADGSTPYQISSATPIPVAVPGHDYACKRTINGPSGTVQVGIICYDSSNHELGKVYDTITLDGNDHTVEKTMVAPANSAKVQTYVSTGPTAQNIYWDEDETYLVEGTSVPQDYGVCINNLGVYGSIISRFAASGSLQISDHFQAKLTIIAFGANDYTAQTPLTTFRSSLQTVIDHAKLYGNIILIGLGVREPHEEYTIPQSDYFEVMEEIADLNSIPYIDIYAAWGSDYYYAKNTLNYIQDTVHPNSAGHASIEQYLENRIKEELDPIEIIGGRVSSQSIYERIGVTFRHDATKTLTVRLYGQYQSVSTQGTDEWVGFTLKEGYDNSYSESQNLLEDPNALFENAESSLLNIPASGKSAVYSFNTDIISEQIGQSPFIKGIQLVMDVENRVNSGIQVQIKSSSGAESEIKTRNFSDENSQIILGDDSDMWDLVSEDIFLEDLTVEVIFSNISQSTITPGYKNLQLILYWMDDETRGNLGFTLIKPGMKGEHSRVYGIFLKPGGIPDGLNPVYSSLRLNKTDGALPIGLDADESELPLEFVVWGSTLQEAYEKLQKISDWLSNDRKGNIPLTNGFIYDAKPSVRYDAILSDVIDVNENVTSLECKTKLTVPKGVAIDISPTHTGSIGTNIGKITVYPVVVIEADGSSSIVVTDDVSTDVITINHTFSAGTRLYINCDKRTIKDDPGNGYGHYVTMNSIWFAIDPGQNYNINVTGGTLQDVYFYLGH